MEDVEDCGRPKHTFTIEKTYIYYKPKVCFDLPHFHKVFHTVVTSSRIKITKIKNEKFNQYLKQKMRAHHQMDYNFKYIYYNFKIIQNLILLIPQYVFLFFHHSNLIYLNVLLHTYDYMFL